MPSREQYDENKANTTARASAVFAAYTERPQQLFWIFFALSGVALVTGLWYWNVSIYKPFIVEQRNDSSEADAQQAVDDFNQLIAEQQRDTDNDGLTDYLETQVYGTSAYLADTDSDGFSDKQEVDQGTNPVCPEGRDCSLISGDQEIQTPTENAVSAPPEVLTVDQALAQEIRSMLVDEGVSAAEVSQLSDEDLLSLFQDAVADNPELQQFFADELSAQPELLDAATIKTLLIEQGADPASLETLSDQALLDLYVSSISQPQ